MCINADYTLLSVIFRDLFLYLIKMKKSGKFNSAARSFFVVVFFKLPKLIFVIMVLS